jgi:hypothetical protein
VGWLMCLWTGGIIVQCMECLSEIVWLNERFGEKQEHVFHKKKLHWATGKIFRIVQLLLPLALQ